MFLVCGIWLLLVVAVVVAAYRDPSMHEAR